MGLGLRLRDATGMVGQSEFVLDPDFSRFGICGPPEFMGMVVCMGVGMGVGMLQLPA